MSLKVIRTYFKNAAEIAILSSVCWSIFVKSPKPLKTGLGLFFMGLLFEGAVATFCQVVAPLFGAFELLWAGLASLVAESIGLSLETEEQTCRLVLLGLASWFVKTWVSSKVLSPSAFPSAGEEPPTCSARAPSPPPRVSSGTETPSLISLQVRLADPELEEEEWCDCGDLPEDDLSERREWLRGGGLLDCFLGERERPLLGLLG